MYTVPVGAEQRLCLIPEPPKDDCDCTKGQVCPGNPINAGSGNKLQQEQDYSPASFALGFRRYYSSRGIISDPSMGIWSHEYQRRLLLTSITNHIVYAYRPTGGLQTFILSADGAWVRDADVRNTIEEIKDTQGVRIGWIFREQDSGVIESYSSTGELRSMVLRSGVVLSFAYQSSPYEQNGVPVRLLTSVTDSFGHSLQFSYGPIGSDYRLLTLTTPDQQLIRYTYSDKGQLTRVTYPDGSYREYVYEVTNALHLLTGLLDEKGLRFATWVYDANGNAVSSEHAGGFEKVSVAYPEKDIRTITDALGNVTSMTFTSVQGLRRVTSTTQPLSCGGAANAMSYDNNGYIATRTDFRGAVTQYTRDSLGRELTRTEAAGTAQERKTTTEWHATFNMPLRIASANKRVINTYDSNGNVLTHSEQASTDNTGSQGFAATVTGPVRSWTYTYNSFGQMLTADGPRSDINDVITYSYYPADDSDINRRGNLASVTNALGQVTQYPSWNANGSPLTMIDANNISTTFAYDARNRLTSRSRAGESTQFEYDPVGQLIKVTLPDGNYLQYSYDDAHRQTRISDKAGNYIEYGYDLMSRRIKEEIHDNVPAGGGLQQQLQRIEEWLRSVTPQPVAEALAEAA